MKYFLCTSLILISFFTQAKQATSDLGYTIEIPNSWSPLTGPEIKANPDLFNFEQIDGIPPALLKQIMPVIQSGNMDLYFIPNNSENLANDFTDNINVMKQVGNVPSNPNELNEVCASAKSELSSVFQRDITLYECKQTKVIGRNALYAKFDGGLEGTVSMQYHFPLSENVFLMFTATAKLDTYETIEKEFQQVINTISLQ
ncbi:hypothetical protein DS885_15340 [Psychromonas sp. B3M02]|uniref:hypothetical protein n=1 Tax=Psychromonas sp. B3M02 TaxID=2267226 RepID=UPI000DE92C0E|nr:hypothetical protein [Psychromonas sp. B3M02]RBW42469.1 hypothetical protein DS885_15340 [Psychromonas sp. B3M02]